MAYSKGNREKIAFVHEINQYKQYALDDFNWIKKNTNFGGNLVSLSFGEKADFPPLQAADILAYETHKRLKNKNGPPRKSWIALGDAKITLGYDKDNMADMMNILQKIYEGKTLESSVPQNTFLPF
jgi:hypothetical protein